MGKKIDGTFVVHISQAENATWQGQVTWADQNEKMNFRSALELIKLMDAAVQSQEAEEEN